MLNLRALYVEHSFTIRNTFQYGATGLQRRDRTTQRLQQLSRGVASRAHPTPTIAGAAARGGPRDRACGPEAELPSRAHSGYDRVEDSTSSLVRGAAEPDDGPGWRTSTGREARER